MRKIKALVGFVIACSVGAYIEHSKVGSEKSRDTYIERKQAYVASAVQSSLRERSDCLQSDPSEWCNRDLTPQQYAAMHSALYEKYDFYGREAGSSREARNNYLFFAGLGLLFLAIAIRDRLQSKGQVAA